MDAYEILAAIVLGLAVLSVIVCVPVLIVGGRTEIKDERFRQHGNDVLAAHRADVRNRGHEANKAARWQG